MHNIAKDLVISLQEDRPGTLARATAAIAKAGINIEGYAEVEGVLHVLAKDAAAARQALEAAGFQVSSKWRTGPEWRPASSGGPPTQRQLHLRGHEQSDRGRRE